MNEKIYRHLKEFCRKEGFDLDEGSILEILQENDHLYCEEVDTKRHWDEFFNVVDVDGMLIGYYDARTTGDLTAIECGWKFDKDLCCEVEEHQITQTVYIPVRC